MNDARWKDMAAAWVLGALDAEEAKTFEARLEGDAELRAEVRAQRELLGVLADAAPARTPPPALKERILSEARASRPITSAPSARPGSSGIFFRILAAAATIAAIALGIGNRQLADEASSLERELQTVESQVDDAVQLIAERDSLLRAFIGPDVRSATLAATGSEPSARVFFNAATGGVVVTAFGLPPAPQGRIYQLWGIAEGEDPVSLGTFQTAPDGTAILRSAAPVGADFAISAVTEEPAGGSAQPTTTPFLVGSWTGD